jgi:hypothetical protein
MLIREEFWQLRLLGQPPRVWFRILRPLALKDASESALGRCIRFVSLYWDNKRSLIIWVVSLGQ